jgi:hypothetical protein
MGTPREVRKRRRFSSAMLLLYQTSSRTEGADVPHVYRFGWLIGEEELGEGKRVAYHHEASKVRHVQSMLHIDRSVDNKSTERE